MAFITKNAQVTLASGPAALRAQMLSGVSVPLHLCSSFHWFRSSSRGWAGSGSVVRGARLPGCLRSCVIWGALANLSEPRCCHPANEDDRSTYRLVCGKG